jgi:hypothetical protein
MSKICSFSKLLARSKRDRYAGVNKQVTVGTREDSDISAGTSKEADAPANVLKVIWAVAADPRITVTGLGPL